MSIKAIKYLVYLPAIIYKIKNWPTYMLDYLWFKDKNKKYFFRNGIVICDREGTVAGTIAVVFIRKHYGNINNCSVIIDIGANVGVFSIYAAIESKNAMVYGFEPVVENYELLKQNINSNDLDSRIKTFNLGVASKTEERKIYISSSPLHSIVDNNANQCSERIIYCTSLEDIIKNNYLSKIDLLKINCEGAEYEILYSTDKECFDKIFDIRLEYHNMDTKNKNINRLKDFLESMGYQTIKLFENSKDDGFLWMRSQK